MRLVCLIQVLALVACGDDEPTPTEPAVCDGTGNWLVTVLWTTGDCGLTGTETSTITITRDTSGTGYILSGSEPNVTLTGGIADDNGSCKLSASEANSDVFGDGTTIGTLAYNLTADITGRITGNGSLSLTGGSNCGQAFTATGTKS